MAINRTSKARGKIIDVPTAPTIETATGGPGNASVAFTPATVGGPAFSYTALSNPGSITATGTSSPITVSGLTAGTSYTFSVRGTNPSGNGGYSTASNSVVPTIATAFESIATTVVGAGGAASVTFSSIPTTFSHLQIRVYGKVTGNDGYDSTTGLNLRFNGDSTNNYYMHYMYGLNYASPGGGYSGVQSACGVGTFSPNIIDILDYRNTNKTKVVKCLSGDNKNGVGYYRVQLSSGLWNSTSAITSIVVFPNEFNFRQYSHIALYGIKGA
jgi:hypothetical protein